MTGRADPGRGMRETAGRGPSVDNVAPPLIAGFGLALVAWLTLGLLTGNLPLPGGSNGGNGPIAGRTPAPSNVVVVPPAPFEVEGQIVYVKAGNVWIQSGRSARQLTSTGRASMPSFSPDGRWVYYVETVDEIGRHRPSAGDRLRRYAMTVPNVMRTRTDGTGEPERIATGRYRSGGELWFYWLRQPVLSPDGRTLAVLSDGPSPTRTNVVVQFIDVETKAMTNPRLPQNAPLGHQDPAWRPDGRSLLFVRNGRDGARGTPSIMRYNPATKAVSALTGPGYLSPSWSRNLQYVAATRTDGFGTDVVILDARTGAELLRLTRDDRSWAPVWSPRGDAIAYLHMEAGIVDLKLVKLEGTGPAWTVGETIDLTELSGLDGGSRPYWFVPPENLPPLPTAAPPSPPAGSAGAPASTAP